MHQASNIFIHAAVYQHLLERAAAADNQQHHGDDLDGITQRIHHLVHAAAPVQTKGEDADQYGNQRRHNRIAEKFRPRK